MPSTKATPRRPTPKPKAHRDPPLTARHKKAVAMAAAKDGDGPVVSVATRKSRRIADEAHAEGITPLEYLLDIMRTDADQRWSDRVRVLHEQLRFQAAVACLPYMHPKLSAVTHNHQNVVPTLPPQITYALDPEATDEDPADQAAA